MLFKQRFWSGLADGTVSVGFRRWKRPTVKEGGTLQSPGGLLAIDEVVRIEPGEITDADARSAGYADSSEVIAELRPDGDLYRVRFRRIGDDPRKALREQTDLSATDEARLAALCRRLDWAGPVLRLISDHPGTVSTDLAERLEMERFAFKQRVRRLKAEGLTESLKIGYRLSTRGEALLRFLERPKG
jgi:hypothetical protein